MAEISFNPVPGTPPSDNSSKVRLTGSSAPADVSASVVERGPVIPVAASNEPDGNTMKLLENAVLEAFGHDNVADLSLTDRKNLMAECKGKIKHVRGRLTRQGDKADDSIVCKTYKDAEGKSYYSFDVTWEIEVELPGGKTVLRRQQEVRTNIETPKNYGSIQEVEFGKYRAMLFMKTYRHVHKAALDPGHRDYERVKDSVDYLRSKNLTDVKFFNPSYNIVFPGKRQSYWDRLVGFQPNQRAWSSVVKLETDSGAANYLEIDLTHTSRKTDGVFTKVKGVWVEPHSREYIAGEKWKQTQAFNMYVDDPRFIALNAMDKMTPDQLSDKLDSLETFGNPFITREQFKERTKERFAIKKKYAEKGAARVNDPFIGALDAAENKGIKEWFTIGVGRFFAEQSMIEKMVLQQAQQFKENLEACRGGDPTKEKKDELRDLVKHAKGVKKSRKEAGKQLELMKLVHAQYKATGGEGNVKKQKADIEKLEKRINEQDQMYGPIFALDVAAAEAALAP